MGTLQRFRQLRAILGRSAKWTVPVMAIGAAALPEGAATPTLPVWTQQAAAFIGDVSGRNSTVILLSAAVLADWLAREAKNTAGEIRMGLRAALKKLRDEAREEAVAERPSSRKPGPKPAKPLPKPGQRTRRPSMPGMNSTGAAAECHHLPGWNEIRKSPSPQDAAPAPPPKAPTPPAPAPGFPRPHPTSPAPAQPPTSPTIGPTSDDGAPHPHPLLPR